MESSNTQSVKQRPAPQPPTINVTDTNTTSDSEPHEGGRRTPPPRYSTIAPTWGENNNTQSGEKGLTVEENFGFIWLLHGI
ncbi:hypothetical protein Pmani_013351 [Petrolisthes manimaculis]|uniref:Uncharacterized protein n=1 Tax=Petrolisthes manimaculis TaxID=1843537 RepID=A0AAE1PXR6_9EUCA|nr:hypothetical protein Pmani_013351 [Petrolisthes manimaculis]